MKRLAGLGFPPAPPFLQDSVRETACNAMFLWRDCRGRLAKAWPGRRHCRSYPLALLCLGVTDKVLGRFQETCKIRAIPRIAQNFCEIKRLWLDITNWYQEHVQKRNTEWASLRSPFPCYTNACFALKDVEGWSLWGPAPGSVSWGRRPAWLSKRQGAVERGVIYTSGNPAQWRYSGQGTP